jgi:HD-GYP domain-containing protein (c-di-GMP phosphodiesterase class II)
VCCCDAFNAMTTDRSYRSARSEADAIDELRACAGTQFDPAVVEAVVAVVERRMSERPGGVEDAPEFTLLPPGVSVQ